MPSDDFGRPRRLAEVRDTMGATALKHELARCQLIAFYSDDDGKRHFDAAFWITDVGDQILADQNGRFCVADPSLETVDRHHVYEVFVVAAPASAAVQAPVPAARGVRPEEYDWVGALLLAEPVPRQKRSRRKTIYCGAQRTRAKAVLKRMFPNREYPSREELPTPDLLNQFSMEYNRVEGMAKPRSRLGKPSDSVVLREVGRKK